ncbi:hypothetical protein HanPSC8_Chr16g0745191 [Helianthus annuus]|nr:hypothetical protein HanPSC8_Chr16g0745191 [Helianthus annuus]
MNAFVNNINISNNPNKPPRPRCTLQLIMHRDSVQHITATTLHLNNTI